MWHWFMCKHKSMMTSPLSLSFFQVVLKVKLQDDASCMLGVSLKVPWYSAKRTSWGIYEVPWGLYKGMSTNTQGQSDIVTHTTNIWNKDYCNSCKHTFFYTMIDYQQPWQYQFHCLMLLAINVHFSSPQREWNLCWYFVRHKNVSFMLWEEKCFFLECSWMF